MYELIDVLENRRYNLYIFPTKRYYVRRWVLFDRDGGDFVVFVTHTNIVRIWCVVHFRLHA